MGDDEQHRRAYGGDYDAQPQNKMGGFGNEPPSDDVTSKVSHFVKNFFNDSPKEQDIVNVYTRTSIQKFSYHGIRATKRIVSGIQY